MAESSNISTVATVDELTLTHLIDAPRERVYQAWTDPEKFAGWWGPEGFSTPASKISLDVRPGGEWSAPIVSESDQAEIPFGGVYREVNSPRHLAFSLVDPEAGDEQLVTVDLTEDGDKTKLVFFHGGPHIEEGLDELAGGWASFFDCLNEYVKRS